MLLAGLAAGDAAQQQFWQLFMHFSGRQVGLHVAAHRAWRP
jgi:hypothetical protein